MERFQGVVVLRQFFLIFFFLTSPITQTVFFFMVESDRVFHHKVTNPPSGSFGARLTGVSLRKAEYCLWSFTIDAEALDYILITLYMWIKTHIYITTACEEGKDRTTRDHQTSEPKDTHNFSPTPKLPGQLVKQAGRQPGLFEYPIALNTPRARFAQTRSPLFQYCSPPL